jgi:hypothetical protein
MVEALINDFNVSQEMAQKDVESFIVKVKQQGMLE